MRSLPLFLFVFLAVVSGGCGDGGGTDALRIDLETFSFDDEIPDGLRLRRLGSTLEAHEAYDLVPVPGGRRGEFQAEGAPDGNYVVEGPEGWWMLHEGGVPPVLARDRQPPLVGMGRAHSLYLASSVPEVRPSTVWAAEQVLPDGSREPVPVTVEEDERGYVVVIRFQPEAWHGALEVVGRIAVGPPPSPPAGEGAPLAEPVRFQASADGSPPVARVRKVKSEPVGVILVPAAESVSVDGLRVRASIEGIPVPSVREAWGQGGIARLRDVPIMDRMLRLEVNGEAGAHRIAPAIRRRQVGLRLLVVGEEPTRRVHYGVPAGLDVDQVQVRPSAAVAFGRVPFERVEDGVTFEAPHGRCWVLVGAGGRWATGFLGGRDDVSFPDLPLANYVEGVAVGGVVDGAPPGTIVRFFREVPEHDQAVLGDGFEVRVEPGGIFQARLPTGRYRVEVTTRKGTWSRPGLLEASAPGARLHVPLESP